MTVMTVIGHFAYESLKAVTRASHTQWGVYTPHPPVPSVGQKQTFRAEMDGIVVSLRRHTSGVPIS